MSYLKEAMNGDKEIPETSKQERDELELYLADPDVQVLLADNPVLADIIRENGQLFEQFRSLVDPKKLSEAKYRSAIHILEAMGLDPLIEGVYNKRGFNK